MVPQQRLSAQNRYIKRMLGRRAQYWRTKRGFAFFCLLELIYIVLVIFFVLKLGVYVRLVKSLLILSFYLSKQLKESSRSQILGVKRL